MKIETLILTGSNNHDWKRSSDFVKQLLEKSEKFSVKIIDNPSPYLEEASNLKGIQLFFMDINSTQWSDLAKKNFETAVSNGTGVVIFHAASNAFEGWDNYEKMCARVFQATASHGEFREGKVVIRDHEHPITKGIGDFIKWDEFYHSLVDKHNTPINVLATVYSDPDPEFFCKGSGKDEPVLFTTEFGKGRIVHQALGHVYSVEVFHGSIGATMISFIYKDFQRLLIRGCEWAATGVVTDIPDSALIDTAPAAFRINWNTGIRH